MVTNSNVVAESERKAKVKSFEDLEVWQLGKELTMLTYELAQSLPEHETYGLGSQIKRPLCPYLPTSPKDSGVIIIWTK